MHTPRGAEVNQEASTEPPERHVARKGSGGSVEGNKNNGVEIDNPGRKGRLAGGPDGGGKGGGEITYRLDERE